MKNSKKLDTNVVHSNTYLSDYIDIDYVNLNKDNLLSNLRYHYDSEFLLKNIFRYLAKVPVFQRASIDSYDDFFSYIHIIESDKSRKDVFDLEDYHSWLQNKSHLQTVEYVEAELFETEPENDHYKIVKKMISESDGDENILKEKVSNYEKKKVELDLISNLGIVTKNVNLVSNFTVLVEI